MAWSTSAPTLPSGSSWGSEKKMSKYEQNHFAMTPTLFIARLSGAGIAVKVDLLMANGEYGDYDGVNGKYYLMTRRSGEPDDENTDIKFPTVVGTKTVYWTGTAAAGETIRVFVGVSGIGSSNQYKDFTAPAILNIPLFANSAGTVYQVEKAYANVSGVGVKEVTVYANVGGEIKEFI